VTEMYPNLENPAVNPDELPYPDQNEVYQTRGGHKARFLMELPKHCVPGDETVTHKRFLYAVETGPDSGCYQYQICHEDGTQFGVSQSGPLMFDIMPFADIRWGRTWPQWRGE